MVDRLYTTGKTKFTINSAGVEFSIMSRRAAFFSFRQTIKNKWAYPAFEFKYYIGLPGNFIAVGYSITGYLITIKKRDKNNG